MKAFAAMLGYSWEQHRALLLPAWLAALTVCLLAAWAGEGLYFFVDFRENGRRYAGLMSLASGFYLMALAWSLVIVAHRARLRGVKPLQLLGWILGAAFACYLAFDEVAQLHETLTHVLQRAGLPKLFGLLDQDIYVFGAYALVALAVLILLRRALVSRGDLLLPALAVAGFLLASQGLDAIPWDSMSHGTQQVVGTAEEVLKTMGTFTLALLGLLLAAEEYAPMYT